MAKERGRPFGDERLDRVLKLLGENQMTVREIAETTGWPVLTVRTGLNWMRREGMAQPVSRDMNTGAKRWSLRRLQLEA